MNKEILPLKYVLNNNVQRSLPSWPTPLDILFESIRYCETIQSSTLQLEFRVLETLIDSKIEKLMDGLQKLEEQKFITLQESSFSIIKNPWAN
jgi:hypothetical protein